MDGDLERRIQEVRNIYIRPLTSSRTGALYNAFSYPTKISPEAIALFIACHTEVEATVLDPFAGSGSTGLAAKLCDAPTEGMVETATRLGLQPKWGKRKAVLIEISTLGAFVSSVMCNPPSASSFEKSAKALLNEVQNELGNLYTIVDGDGKEGIIRYVIWSDILICSKCQREVSFWQSCVKEGPIHLSEAFHCPECGHREQAAQAKRATEVVYDELLQKSIRVKKRIPVKIYGRTGKKKWSRLASEKDICAFESLLKQLSLVEFPLYKMAWGGLYRSGYHQGITHLHHFYTKRNALVFSRIWSKIPKYPEEIQGALRLLALSYNSSHSTLMTRVVVKKDSRDFVITGSQSGVLYISNLPVEKNILDGIDRKISTLKQAFRLVEGSQSSVGVFNSSSTFLSLPDRSVDYVFTDPPFGDYIPYSEINQVNEAWLGRTTDKTDEVIVDSSQKKGILEYNELMCAVFAELSRALKDDGLMSLVFHSAKAEVWQALINSYQRADLQVIFSSILDKIQASFKQTISSVKVQGDPLLLLAKSAFISGVRPPIARRPDVAIIKRLVKAAFVNSANRDEQKPERLFSRYINACLESGSQVTMNAGDFYAAVHKELAKYQYSS